MTSLDLQQLRQDALKPGKNPGRFPGWVVILLVVIYFAVMTVVMTWPLVLHMRREMVGQIGDNIYFVWMIGWIKKAVFDLGVNPFNVWFLNYPQGWNMAYTEIPHVLMLIAVPLSFIDGPTLAYNLTLMLTFVLSGLTMFLWIRSLTGRTDAALIAGTIFAFLPYRFAHFLAGHLNLSGTMWLPLYFWGLYDLLESIRGTRLGKPAWKPATLAAVGLGLTGLTSQYYLYMAILISAFLIVVYVLVEGLQSGAIRIGKAAKKSTSEQIRPKLLIFDRRFWGRLALMGLIALPFVALAVGPYIVLNQQGGLPDRNMAVVRMYSASPTDFILPSTDHFAWGGWIGSHFNRELWIEATLYIGAVSAALALLAFIRRKQLVHGRLLSVLLWSALFAMLLAMGTDLHWLSKPVSLPVPAFLSHFTSRSSIPLLLPGYWMFLHFPFYAKLRAFMRFGVFVLVFISAAAGLGGAWLLEKANRKWQPLLALGLLGLVFLDFYPGPYTQFALVQSRSVDAWLAAQPGSGAVIQFPFVMGEDQDQTYYTLINGKPFVGGFFNAFPPSQYSEVKPVMAHFPDNASVAMLPKLGVKYVLVDDKSYSNMPDVQKQCEAYGLSYIGQYGNEWVFER